MSCRRVGPVRDDARVQARGVKPPTAPRTSDTGQGGPAPTASGAVWGQARARSVTSDGDHVATTTVHQDLYYDPYDLEILGTPIRCSGGCATRRRSTTTSRTTSTRSAGSRTSRRPRRPGDLLSRKGVLLDMIKADIEMPAGTLIHDGPRSTPPTVRCSRGSSRRSPWRDRAQVREFCVGRLDPLVGTEGFDVVAELGQHVPCASSACCWASRRKTRRPCAITSRRHMTLGAREAPDLRRRLRERRVLRRSSSTTATSTRRRSDHPSDQAPSSRTIDGTRRTLTRDEALMYLNVIAGAGNHTTNRLIGGPPRPSPSTPTRRREVVQDRSLVPNTIEETLRYEPSSTQIARYVEQGRRDPRPDGSRGQRHALPGRLRQPRRADVPRRRPLRHPPQDRAPPHVRLRRRTSVSVRPWRDSKAAWCSRRCSSASPTGKSTTTAAGWDIARGSAGTRRSPSSSHDGLDNSPSFRRHQGATIRPRRRQNAMSILKEADGGVRPRRSPLAGGDRGHRVHRVLEGLRDEHVRAGGPGREGRGRRRRARAERHRRACHVRPRRLRAPERARRGSGHPEHELLRRPVPRRQRVAVGHRERGPRGRARASPTASSATGR